LQSLLPSIDASGKETVMQSDLPAQGLRIPGFPTILGPFGFTDVRASLSWSLVDVQSLRNYLAARHNFAAAQLSAEDARDMGRKKGIKEKRSIKRRVKEKEQNKRKNK